MKKLSVLIANRHATSISLEDEFIDALKKISKALQKSVNDIVTEIDSKREKENLSSAVRVYILKEIEKHSYSKQ
ncbi:MAG TPA: aryl-sulfate sulfotransferase [Alphaproteobacteria bacterium]|nr:aryl-sulfate sulfotransferase [Alphaproteobacteria bacterium]